MKQLKYYIYEIKIKWFRRAEYENTKRKEMLHVAKQILNQSSKAAAFLGKF